MTSHAQPSHRAPRASPELAVRWESRRGMLWSNLRALLYGPAPPKSWPTSQYFRDSWVRSNFPKKALLASMLLHIAFFNFHFTIPGGSAAARPLELPRIELVYYGPIRDLPPISAPKSDSRKLTQPSPPGEPAKPLPPRGANALRLRQTIISAPPRITHPRQTLIQPDAPAEPPKIISPLPNIVQWNAAARPARPRLQLDPSKLRARVTATRRAVDPEAPQIQNQERAAGPLNIAASPVLLPKPKLAIAPSAIPRAGPRDIGSDVMPAPEVGPSFGEGDPNARRVIALSANPAPMAPIVDLPLGNLRAAITLSPEGSRPGVPGGANPGMPGATGGANGGPGSPGGNSGGGGTQPGTGGGAGNVGASGPEGISINGGDPKNTASVSGNGGAETGASRSENPLFRSALPDRPTSRAAKAGTQPFNPAKSSPRAALEKSSSVGSPETIFGPKRTYTLNVNMPNLSSATGSWILQFAEMDEEGPRRGELSNRPLPGDLAGPVPLRKVDPKYPPVLKNARVEGEVVLYAIIRKNGSVDSIQLVRGLDPRLDQNAMEALAQWKFRPAERNGAPVELEALVRIPFRVLAPD